VRTKLFVCAGDHVQIEEKHGEEKECTQVSFSVL
jgi:hypothetical protein